MDHAYLQKKNIPSIGLRRDGCDLLVPMINIDNQLMNLQRIQPDGAKRFLKHGQITGCFARIGKPITNKLIICEGWVTGMTLYLQTKTPIACAMTCGNLRSVAIVHRFKYPNIEIILAADMDHRTKGNPGLTKATEAAKAANGTLIVPVLPCGADCRCTDWNDYLTCAAADAKQVAEK